MIEKAITSINYAIKNTRLENAFNITSDKNIYIASQGATILCNIIGKNLVAPAIRSTFHPRSRYGIIASGLTVTAINMAISSIITGNQSLFTYGAIQSIINTVWNGLGSNLVSTTIRSTFNPLDERTLRLAITGANLAISSSIGTVVGKYLVDYFSTQTMAWNQAIKTTILNSAPQFALQTIAIYRN